MFIRNVDGGSPAGRAFASSELGETGGLDLGRGDAGGVEESSAPTFSDVLGNLVVQASSASQSAAVKADMLARGASDDLHGTMIAAKEAEISVKLVGSIRNKLIDAFQELWRTNV